MSIPAGVASPPQPFTAAGSADVPPIAAGAAIQGGAYVNSDTMQFVIRVAAITLCIVLAGIVGSQVALVFVLHDGAQTANVVASLTDISKWIVTALIIAVGGSHASQILSTITAGKSGGQ